mmetsp:Transcript_45296/g.142557  ORF Transcript_45296/g.142557 Transcript_45296/m.142557 type:complete len:257 (-) Transcript_45296:165-935(-)
MDKVRRADPLEHSLEVVRAVKAELELSGRHASKHGTSQVGDQLVHHPAEHLEASLMFLALRLQGIQALLLNYSASDETEAQEPEDHAADQPGQEPGGSRVEDGLEALDVAVPEPLGGHAQVRADHLEVLAAEQINVVLCKDLEELLELDVLAACRLGLRQCNLSSVEVHRRNPSTLDEVVEGVAPCRCDGDHVIVLGALEHGMVDTRILPRHIVDVGVVISNNLEHGHVRNLVDQAAQNLYGTHLAICATEGQERN